MQTSMAPKRQRTVARPEKSLHTACIATTMPQSIHMIEKYRERENLCIKNVAGISPPRYPKLFDFVNRALPCCLVDLNVLDNGAEP